MGNKVSLEEEMINLKIVSKQMNRSSKKCEKNQKGALAKLKKAIEKGNHEGARIYAQDAIREKNQALNSIKMASRIDACASRIETAVRMGQVTGSMQGVVKAMDRGIQSLDIDKISTLMDKFESQFEDLDVKTLYMEGTMNATTAMSTPGEQVDDLIMLVADEHNLELGDAFTEAGPVGKKVSQPVAAQPQAAEPVDDLQSRLANLSR